MLNRIYKSAAKKISASRYGTAVISGKKLSASKLKEHILDEIKSGGISGKKLEEVLKEEGMNKMQIAKRKRLIKRLTGTDVTKLSKKELSRQQERVKMRIAAARLTSDRDAERGGGMAGSRKEVKRKALERAMTTGEGEDKTKVGMGSLGISDKGSSFAGGSSPAPSTGGGSMGGGTPGGTRPIGL